MKGYSDDLFKEKIIPELILIETQKLKLNSKQIIDRIMVNFPPPLPPKAVIANNDQTLRRYDSLARLLCPSSKISACVAVSFYEGKWIIASNNSISKTNAELSDLLAKRMTIIQDFINEIAKDINLEDIERLAQNDSQETLAIVFSPKARFLAHQVIEALMDNDNGGYTKCIPQIKNNRKLSRSQDIDHFKNALFKITQHYLLGLYTQGKQGFSKSETDALLSPDVSLVIPEFDTSQLDRLHAEQAILSYLYKETGLLTQSEGTVVSIGISKLCCQTCHYVLDKGELIAYRGTHGMGFPNVKNILDDEFKISPTTTTGDPFAADSDSECEFDEDEFYIPKMEDLIDAEDEEYDLAENSNLANAPKKSDALPRIKDTFSHRFLLRPCHTSSLITEVEHSSQPVNVY